MVTLLCRKNRKTPKRWVLLRFGHLIGTAGLQGERDRHHFIDPLGHVVVGLLVLLEYVEITLNPGCLLLAGLYLEDTPDLPVGEADEASVLKAPQIGAFGYFKLIAGEISMVEIGGKSEGRKER